MSFDRTEIERLNAAAREIASMEAKRKRLDDAIQRRKESLNFNRRLVLQPAQRDPASPQST